MNAALPQTILVALSIGAAAGMVGAFMLARRMALVSDALSHVALPGIALALSYNIDPFWGVLSFLTVAAIVVWKLEKSTRLPAEAIIGLLFTTSLAIGVLAIPNVELLESLFGEFSPLSPAGFAATLAATAAVIGITLACTKRFLLSTVAPEAAETEDRKKLYDLALLMLFSVTVALGIKLVGSLLMGAIAIVPAATARNVAGSSKVFILTSAVLGAATTAGGVLASDYLRVPPGPTSILIGVALFLISLGIVALAKRNH